MSLEGAPGQSDVGAQGPGQEGDSILRAWTVPSQPEPVFGGSGYSTRNLINKLNREDLERAPAEYQGPWVLSWAVPQFSSMKIPVL